MSFHPRGIMQTSRLIWPHFASSRNERAGYGSNLLNRLVKDLKEQYGVGFNRYNLQYMRKLYVAFPKVQTLSELLSWSHYVEILKGDAPLEAVFYVILINSCLFILFPKCAINAAFRKQNNIPYFLGQIIDATLYQCIIPILSVFNRRINTKHPRAICSWVDRGLICYSVLLSNIT